MTFLEAGAAFGKNVRVLHPVMTHLPNGSPRYADTVQTGEQNEQ